MSWKAFSFALLFLLVGLALGEKFPDVDQGNSFLVHRSIITHGPLFPLLLFLLALIIKAVPIRFFVMGFSLGVAVHLCFALFPKAWVGYALIHVPVVGWTYPLVSWVWIALSIILCLFMAMRLVRSGLHGMALVLGLLLMFGYASVSEEAVWGPLLAVIVAAVIGLIPILWRTTPGDY
jgi:hypothetical protein